MSFVNMLGETKVSNFKSKVPRQENILWFDISVKDGITVQKVQTRDKLSEVNPCYSLGERTTCYKVENFATKSNLLYYIWHLTNSSIR